MYSYFEGKPCLNLWCDGSRDQEEDIDEEAVPRKKPKKESKRNEQEKELEDEKRHGNEYSGPQLRLWARQGRISREGIEGAGFVKQGRQEADH
jgi:hypothetical protein